MMSIPNITVMKTVAGFINFSSDGIALLTNKIIKFSLFVNMLFYHFKHQSEKLLLLINV